MPVTEERLVAVLEAKVTKFEKDMRKAATITRGEAEKIENSLEKMRQRIDKISGVSGKGFQSVGRNATVLKGQMGNLSAQFQDIAVQLQGGQSPFTIALQQGTQITQVLGPLGARGAVSALGGAFASLVNPVSLATIGLIAAGGAAVQYFTSLLDDSASAERTLEEQASLIQKVADRWGEAVPALQAYADELQRQADLGDLNTATQDAINAKFRETQQLLPDIKSQIGGIVQEMIRAGATQAEINAVRDAFNSVDRAAQDLNRAFAEGADTTEQFKTLQEALASLMANEAVSGTDALSGSIANLSNAYRDAAASAAELAAQAANAASAAGGKSGRLREGQTNPLSDYDFSTRFSGGLGGLFNTPAKSGGKSGGGGRSASISAIERERQAVADLIDRLEFEQRLIGMTALEREKEITLRRAGSAATEEQRQRIGELVEATYAETEALRANQQAMQELNALGRDVLGGFINDLMNGKSAADALAGALQKVANKLIEIALNDIFGGSGGLGGLLGGLFGGGRGFFPPAPMSVGLFHKGGIVGQGGAKTSVNPAVFAGAPRYHSGGMAGLKPGEVPAILQRGEMVIPRNQVGRGGGGRSVVEIRMSKDVEANVIKRAQDNTVQIMRGAFSERDKTNTQRVAAGFRDARDRKMIG